MDLLGKQGEEASEKTERLEKRLGKAESHLKAVDAALQDFADNYQGFLTDELDYQEQEISRLQSLVERIDEEDSKIEEVEKRLDRLDSRLTNHEKKVEQLISCDLEETFSVITKEFKQTKNLIRGFRKRLDGLENKMDDIESEFMIEINNREFDFDKKLDKREFNDREKKLEKEISKLRSSVTFLADQLDEKDSIELE